MILHIIYVMYLYTFFEYFENMIIKTYTYNKIYENMFEIVVACNANMVIGKDNDIPWYVKEDLYNFQRLTTGHIVIMGRKTYESLPNKPMKNRYNIVLTSNPDKYSSNFENLVFTTRENLSNILHLQKQKWGERVFVIGGSDIYKHFIPYCSKIHITLVDVDVDGDTFFPCSFDDLTNIHGFRVINCSVKMESKTDDVMYQFQTYAKCTDTIENSDKP